MTLRQILDVLWKRRWIVVVVVLLAVMTAFAYLQMRTVTYLSEGTVRLNSAVTEAALGGEIAGVPVALDEEVGLSPAVLEPAAEEIGESAAQLGSVVSLAVNSEPRLAQVTISAEGATPELAQQRAQAVMDSYIVYVDTQMAALLEELQLRQQEAIADVRAIQDQLESDPADPIANVNLASALSKMTTYTAGIEQITDAGTANTTVLSDASPGELQVPTALVVLAVAFATGLIVGIAIALIRDQFDNRLRGEDEVETLTGARSIGELSWDRKLARVATPLPVASTERTDLSERLRTLRSNLTVFLPSKSAAFVVTSVEPGDGKSFASANLALAWARAGKKTILVGGDLRRPNLDRYFGDSADGEGLSDILSEHEVGAELTLEAVTSRLNATRYRRLMVLPAGPEPEEPADLFARPVLADVIRHLRALADVIVIDSPPAIGMADAALLASQTDGAIVLASVHRTDRVRLVESIESLRAAGTEVLGVVANRSRRKLPKTYSSYYISGAQESRGSSFAPARSPMPDAPERALGGAALASPLTLKRRRAMSIAAPGAGDETRDLFRHPEDAEDTTRAFESDAGLDDDMDVVAGPHETDDDGERHHPTAARADSVGGERPEDFEIEDERRTSGP